MEDTAEEPTLYRHLKTQPGANPLLPRTTQPTVTPNSAALSTIKGYELGLPGPRFRDDYQDFSPFFLELDCADPFLCSKFGMTPLGHGILVTPMH